MLLLRIWSASVSKERNYFNILLLSFTNTLLCLSSNIRWLVVCLSFIYTLNQTTLVQYLIGEMDMQDLVDSSSNDCGGGDGLERKIIDPRFGQLKSVCLRLYYYCSLQYRFSSVCHPRIFKDSLYVKIFNSVLLCTLKQMLAPYTIQNHSQYILNTQTLE